MRFLINPISGQLTAAPSKEIVYSDTAPFAPLEGLRWADTTNLREYIFTDGYWVEVGVGFVGPVGPIGLTGAPGTAATVAVGTTTTGAAGTSAAVSNSGTSSAATLDFTIPKGVDGINGAVGATGDSAYQSAVNGGYAFSEAAWVASLKGVTGDAATVAVGTTTTGAAGTSAAVSNAGTTSAAVFNFTVPKGDVGATGTAATVAVGTTTTGVAGTSATVSNSGTSSEAILNFTIPRGDKGADGTSVVIKGSVATSASLPTTNRTIGDVWIASDTGFGWAWSGSTWSNVGKIQGPACTVAVGTTTTGVAGTSASVSNSGITSAATLNFTIPKGDAGVAGPQGIKGDTGLPGIQGPAGPAPSGTGAVVVSNGVLQTPIVVTTANTASTIVQRDASGNFSAGTITGTFSGNVTGNVTGGVTGNAGSATQLATARSINVSGDVTGTAQTFDGSANITIPTAITADSIVNADINSAAAIADTKLATIATAGKVSNSATTATSANAANAIVARDNSGNFSAGTITANLTGSVSGNAANVTGTVAIANGGTGSTTAAAALIALGAAATSHQHGAGDITSGTLANAQLPARLQAASQTITDWNNALENGWYQGNRAASAPEGVLDWWLGCVETHYDRWVTQTVHRFTVDAPTNTQIWRRSSADSGATVRTFSAWYKLQLSQGEQDARYAATSHTHPYSQITDSPYKDGVTVATATPLSVVYSNGTSGVGATLESYVGGILVVDGVTTSVGMRVLVKNQTSLFENGIYTVTSVGTATTGWLLTRATDADSRSELAGAIVSVDRGASGGKLFSTSFTSTSVVGTAACNWQQIYDQGDASSTNTANTLVIRDASGNFSAGVVTATKIVANASTPTVGAVVGVNGLMSASDKTKLDGVATNANNYAHPTGDGNLHVPATSATNNGKVLKAGAAAGSLSWGTLTAADVGAAATSHTHPYSQITDSPYKDGVTVATTGSLPTYGLQKDNPLLLTGDVSVADYTAIPIIDGVTVTVGMRILVKNQGLGSANNPSYNYPEENGIYAVTRLGTATTGWLLTRAADADSSSELAGATVSVDRGTANGGKLFKTSFASTNTVATTACKWQQIVTSDFSELFPAGAIMPFARNKVPAGWLAANGAVVDREVYANLFAQIGEVYGAPSPATFGLPDLRAVFVRGAGTNAVSGEASGTFGANQADAIQNIKGKIDFGSNSGLNVTMTGAFYSAEGATSRQVGFGSGSVEGDYSFDASRVVRTDTETRPRNIAMLYCIKY